MVIQERYTPVILGVDASSDFAGSGIGGFLCTTTGTITIVANYLKGTQNVTVVNAMAVTAGVYYPIPFHVGGNGGTVTLGAGASGVLGVI